MAPRSIVRKDTQFERQMTYSKRSKGLLKKVFELSVLCDVDVALIMYAPNGRLRHFSNKSRPERILQEYIQHQATIPEKNEGEVDNSVKPVISQDTIEKINMLAGQVEAADQHGLEANHEKEINEETKKLILLQELHKKLFLDTGTSKSIEDLEERKRFLVEVLHRIEQRKKSILLRINIGTYGAHISQPSLQLQTGEEEQPQQEYQKEIETPFVAQPQEMQQFDVPPPLPELFEISKDLWSLDDIVNANMSQKTPVPVLPPGYLENWERCLLGDRY